MSKDLHRSIPQFVEKAFGNHNKVAGFEIIPDDDFLLYKIQRVFPLAPLNVHLSDAYLYALHDFYTRPIQIKTSGFVLIARPEACYTVNVVSPAKLASLAIGKFSALMGALNYEEYWNYNPPERRDLGPDDKYVH